MSKFFDNSDARFGEQVRYHDPDVEATVGLGHPADV